MKMCHAGLTGPVHSTNDSHCHIKDTEEFPALDPLTEDDEWRVSSLCTGRYSQNSAEEEP